MPLRLLVAAVAALAVAPAARPADPLPPADRPVESVIDDLIYAAIRDQDVTPAPQADDATIIRRATLDLVGRIPTANEVDVYVASTDPTKREKLVERLMNSPGYARHQADRFDAMFNPGDARRGGGLRDYFQSAIAERKPWDRVFREVMLPDQNDPEQKKAAEYLRDRSRDVDRMTTDVSAVFFGVNVSCAQCHDHPLVADWKQDHFYGMKSFLDRTYDANGFLAERGVGVVKFTPNKGKAKTAEMMFLTGATVEHPSIREMTKDEQKTEKDVVDKAKKDKQAPPAPDFSARAELVKIALNDGNARFFSRSIVNRMWDRFFGLGLVNPLDQMHSENPPLHPRLLDWLARDLAAHGYDLNRLVRGIVLSEAYSRSSRYPSESVPDMRLFAVARLKPLTPRQLATSLKIATTDPAEFDGIKPEEVEKKIEGLENAARGFADQIVEPGENFQVGVDEALLFSNSDRVFRDFIRDGNGTLLKRLKDAKDSAEAVGVLTKVVYGRPPSDAEREALVGYLDARSDRRDEAYRQVIWAMVTGPEFRFCY